MSPHLDLFVCLSAPIIDLEPKCKVKSMLGIFSMTAQYTISQLARLADIPVSTVRYYERVGLVQPEDRSQGNYRLYSQESLRRLEFIRAAQASGFTLDHIKMLLGNQDGSAPSCREVQGLIEERLGEIGQRLKDLRHVQKVLKASLQKCQETEQAGCCHVVETLRGRSTTRRITARPR